MADRSRVTGNRVFCHVCRHDWDRAQGGLECPECRSEFVEIIESDPGSESESRQQHRDASPPSPRPSYTPPMPHNPLQDHNPWAPDPDEDDIATIEFNTGGGRGTFQFTSRTYTFGGGSRTSRDPAAEEVGRNFESMLADMLGGRSSRRTTHIMGGGLFQFPPQQRRGFAETEPNQPPDLFSMLFPALPGTRQQTRQQSPLELLGMLLNPGNAQHGDAVFSQEAFDRVMTQLMEQNTGSGAPPASEAAIEALKTKSVDESMMGSDGKAECSICMDNVEIGDEVTTLPCNHWFHGECVVSWLKEHDTCPHCRQAISTPASRPHRQNEPSHDAQRSPAVASPSSPAPHSEDGPYSPQVMDTPSGLRDARRRYYDSMQDNTLGRSRSERGSNSRPDRQSDGGGSGGVGGWIRSHMPFS